jgi:hypothetical protein
MPVLTMERRWPAASPAGHSARKDGLRLRHTTTPPTRRPGASRLRAYLGLFEWAGCHSMMWWRAISRQCWMNVTALMKKAAIIGAGGGLKRGTAGAKASAWRRPTR